MSLNNFPKLNHNLVRLNFVLNLKTTSEKIWDILWNPNKVSDWLKIFDPSTVVVGNMEEEENIRFMNANNSGMNSIVISKVTNKQIVFQHIGMIEDGQPSENEEYKIWENAMEGYFITEKEGSCIVDIFVETTEDHIDYFNTSFNKVLDYIKNNA